MPDTSGNHSTYTSEWDDFSGLRKERQGELKPLQATSWDNAARQWVNLVCEIVILLFSNCASAWMNHTSGEIGPKGWKFFRKPSSKELQTGIYRFLLPPASWQLLLIESQNFLKILLETLLWYLGLKNAGTRSKPISGMSAREITYQLTATRATQNNKDINGLNIYFVCKLHF